MSQFPEFKYVTQDEADAVALKYGTAGAIAERASRRANSASVYLRSVAGCDIVCPHKLRAAISHLEQALLLARAARDKNEAAQEGEGA